MDGVLLLLSGPPGGVPFSETEGFLSVSSASFACGGSNFDTGVLCWAAGVSALRGMVAAKPDCGGALIVAKPVEGGGGRV